MKWKGKRQSTNIEDRRGHSSGRRGGGMSGNMIAMLIKLLFSKVGLIIVGLFIVGSLITGNNPLTLAGEFLGGGQPQTEATAYTPSAEESEMAAFCATILASTEDVWHQILPSYREPELVLFTGSVQSACGSASSATGPFYCPGDEKLYLDLGFFDDMAKQLNAPGDFAQAYVIAHEVGHHVQNIMGTTDKVHNLRRQLSEKEYNKYSVMLELQADFYAGVWAYHSEQRSQMMEAGDLEEALNAAFAIGDDRLQKQSTGTVVPDSFTHGTSAQRMHWFKKGFETGDVNQGDTFGGVEF